MARLLWLSTALLVLAGCSRSGGLGGPPATQRAPDSTLVSGISQEEAISLARANSSVSSFVSATSGPFSQLDTHPDRTGPGYHIEPDDLVWAVKFSGDMTICGPPPAAGGDSCQSPRPGFTTVFLAYRTGTFLSSQTFSPSP
jgi:hypothetical protein